MAHIHSSGSASASTGRNLQPLHIGGVDIAPGDYIYADEDGVIVSSKRLPDAE